MKKDGIIYTVIFSFLVTFAFVFPLALANEGTRDIVAKNAETARQKAVLTALNVPFGSDAEAETLYGGVKIADKNGTPLYTFQKNDATLYAKEFSGNGLWGTIMGVLAVNSEVNEIVGLEIISHNETPGLGGRIDEASFKDQFKGEKIKDGKLIITAGAEAGGGKKDPSDGIVDGITGATRTSQSLDIIMNREISDLKKLLGANR